MPHSLVLNASYEPLCVVPQRRAVVLVLNQKAVTLEAAGASLHAARIPATIAITAADKRRRATFRRIKFPWGSSAARA